jgi:hypothetical protein
MGLRVQHLQERPEPTFSDLSPLSHSLLAMIPAAPAPWGAKNGRSSQGLGPWCLRLWAADGSINVLSQDRDYVWSTFESSKPRTYGGFKCSKL